MKFFQGLTDEGCKETGESILIISNKECATIIGALQHLACGNDREYFVTGLKIGERLTEKQAKNRAKKALEILKDILY